MTRGSGIAVVERLYGAMNARDPEAILDAMTEDFVGEVSRGMPHELGGRHEGRAAMLEQVWGRVFASYEVRLDVESYHDSEEGTVFAIGNYRGATRAGGREFDARFVHIFTIDGERVSSIEQVTDTRCWPAGP